MANFSILERFEIKGWQNDECLYKYVHVHNKQKLIPHGKCFVHYLIFMGSFLYQKLTCSLCSLIQLVTYSQLVHKYSMGTLSSKYYILYNDVSYLFFC